MTSRAVFAAALLALLAAGAGQAMAAPPVRAPLQPPMPRDELSYEGALDGLMNVQTCRVHADGGAIAALDAQLHAIEAAARAKGLGPTLDRVRERWQAMLAIESRMACGGGPAAALAGARRGVAAFQAWVAGASVVPLTPEQREAEVVRTIAALEEAYATAEIARGEAALRRVLNAPQRDGTMSREQLALLDSVARTAVYREAVTERQVEVRGNKATASGIVAITYAGPTGAPVRRYRFTESFESRNGIWRLVERHRDERPLP
jgi:hypothetical protein